jgi:hypothetical protein
MRHAFPGIRLTHQSRRGLPRFAVQAMERGVLLASFSGWLVRGKRSTLCALLILATAGIAFLPARAIESTVRYFYVSPEGNNDWSGTLSTPNAEGTDGPFATLSRAQAAVRDARAEKPTRRYVVLVRGGTYRLTSPIRFGPEDSGTQGAPVTYAAYPGEQPVFSGAREITGWRQFEPNVWRSAPFGSFRFDQLYVDGDRRQRARKPDAGYLLTDGSLPEPMNTQGFYFRDNDIEEWSDLSNAIVHVLHSWSASVHRIAERNGTDHSVTLTNPTAWFGMSYFERNERYYVENVRAAFNAPGEWFLDPNTNRALYRPLPGDDMTSISVLAPSLERLLIFEGDAEAGQFVEHIEFEGLSFHHTDWAVNLSNMADGQSAQFLGAAVQLRDARSVALRNVEVAHVGEYAISIGRGSQDIDISGTQVYDAGGGGIKIGLENDPASPELEVRDVRVLDSTIHGVGRVFPAGTAIWIAKASDNTISHNEIYDTYWTSVSVGWRWDDTYPSHAEGNLISYNDIHDIGQGVLNDMAGIYTLGVSPGTVVRNNVVHGVRTHVPTFPYGPVDCCGTDAIGWGLYADGMSSEIRFFNNIVYDVQTAAFNEGSDNGFLRVYNNIFDPGGFTAITRSFENTSDPTRLALKLERNIIVTDSGDVLGFRWRHNNSQFDSNLYWAPDPLVFWEQYFRPDLSAHYGEGYENIPRTLDEWRSLGQDPNSLIADPMFVDRQAHDYRLLPESPAFDVGFESINIDEVGPRPN